MFVQRMLPRARERLAVCDHGDVVGVLTKTDIVGQIGRCTGSGCTASLETTSSLKARISIWAPLNRACVRLTSESRRIPPDATKS